MKKHRKLWIFAISLAVLGLLAYWLLRTPDPVDFVAEVLEIDLPRGQVLETVETHGGFHGDGETYIVIQFEEDISRNLTGEYWHDLPMSLNVSTVFYGREAEHTTYGPLLSGSLYENGDFGEPVLPSITNGCWYFYDRHEEAADPASDAWLYNRHSWNFTAAVYDADTKTLYYFAFDT